MKGKERDFENFGARARGAGVIAGGKTKKQISEECSRSLRWKKKKKREKQPKAHRGGPVKQSD